ncbi:hypothetical protein A1O3_04455 [Capronia epimyces CBS 606.96]|uniref:NTF2-like domain-containing protein n=1 Tax=Capronia epimyces CBS 606.96 TaxID=1182542 RepID=W9YCV6_9EURO|nr:uncharacterized protein A1O3_04455 [Capronia epimyces CBS 606.96]EXJ87495.1 hypothetical protein A1O3_04455 [Capronia epimyces CBS 606.96]
MRFLSIALPLAALIAGSVANPLEQRGNSQCKSNACLAAVTGKDALGDGHLRGEHCSSFLATTVTPPAITETVTLTGSGKDAGHWKRASVTVCPNHVPNYASACDEAAYTSACSCYGFTDIKTTTIAPTTTTKTVYVAPTGPAVVVSGTTCPAAETSTVTTTVGGSGWATATTVTKTITAPGNGTATTVTVSGSATATTVTKTITAPGNVTATTVTVSGTGSACSSATTTAPGTTTTSSVPASSCVVDDAKATELTNNFATLLEYTSYAGNPAQGAPAGRGYKQDISDATLSDQFTDISDSINFMAGFPLGSVTFASKAAFDYGQGVLQPEVSVTTLNVFHDCNSVTWRYRLLPNPQALPVTGINHFIIDADGKILKNYAEFDNGAWLQSFGQQCAINNVTVSPNAPATRRSMNNKLMNARAFHQ